MHKQVLSILFLLLLAFSCGAQSNLSPLQWQKQKAKMGQMIGGGIVLTAAGTGLIIGGNLVIIPYMTNKDNRNQTRPVPLATPVCLYTFGAVLLGAGIALDVLGAKLNVRLNANPPVTSRSIELQFNPAGSLALRF